MTIRGRFLETDRRRQKKERGLWALDARDHEKPLDS
jgi:hypothetical protein